MLSIILEEHCLVAKLGLVSKYFDFCLRSRISNEDNGAKRRRKTELRKNQTPQLIKQQEKYLDKKISYLINKKYLHK